MRELRGLVEAVTEFASRAAEKLRRQQHHACRVLVFIHTSPFRRDEPQYSRAVTVPLRLPTADSAHLVRAAVRGLEAIYREGYNFAKAGVHLLELQAAGVEQGELALDDATAGRDRLMQAMDGVNMLEAVRAAQECLEPHRRRELKAWSLVEGRLQPKLDEALSRLRGASSQPAAKDAPPQADSPVGSAPGPDDAADARAANVMPSQPGAGDEGGTQADASGPSEEAGQAAQAQGDEGAAGDIDAADIDAAQASPPPPALDLFGDRPASQGPVSAGAAQRPRAGRGAATAGGHGTPAPTAASVTVDPAAIEAALVVALQSPAVEEALVDLFSRTMAKALLRTGTGEARPLPAQPPRSQAQRVLLAGFPDAQQKALMEALGASFDVRVWKPTNGPQAFQALARLCRVVVVPEEADEVEAGLKGTDVRVIRHAGNAIRLIERIGELG